MSDDTREGIEVPSPGLNGDCASDGASYETVKSHKKNLEKRGSRGKEVDPSGMQKPFDPGLTTMKTKESETKQEDSITETSDEGISDVEFDLLVKDCKLKRLRYKCSLCGEDKVENKGGVDVPHYCSELKKKIQSQRSFTNVGTVSLASMSNRTARAGATEAPKDTHTTLHPTASNQPIFHSSCKQVIIIDNQGVPKITDERLREILAEAQRRQGVDQDAKRKGLAPPYESHFPPESRGRYWCHECDVELKGHDCPYRAAYRLSA